MQLLCCSCLVLMFLILTKGTEIKKSVLEEILHNFMDQVEKEQMEQGMKSYSFSFILALPGTQCIGDVRNFYIATFYDTRNKVRKIKQVLKNPKISTSTSAIFHPSNHMAILTRSNSSSAEEELLSDIEWFANQRELKYRWLDMQGCIVFFTRHSPCLKEEVLDLLSDPPFSDQWINDKGIDKYFVFSSESSDKGECVMDAQPFTETDNLKPVLPTFTIVKCTRLSNSNSYKC